jgi:iron complex outermembrane receptor protein
MARPQYGSDAIAGVINIILKKARPAAMRKSAWANTRSATASKTVRGSTGFNLGDDGWVRIAIEAADRDPTNRAGADFRNPAEPRYGKVNQRFGDPETKPRVLFLNSQYRVSDDIDWYAFANYGQRTPRPPPPGAASAARRFIRKASCRWRTASRPTPRWSPACAAKPRAGVGT